MIRKTINGPTPSITMTRRVKVSLGVAAGAIGEDTDTPAEDEPTQADLRQTRKRQTNRLSASIVTRMVIYHQIVLRKSQKRRPQASSSVTCGPCLVLRRAKETSGARTTKVDPDSPLYEDHCGYRDSKRTKRSKGTS